MVGAILKSPKYFLKIPSQGIHCFQMATEITPPDPVPTEHPNPILIGSRPDDREAAIEQRGVPLTVTRTLNQAEISDLTTLVRTEQVSLQTVTQWIDEAVGYHRREGERGQGFEGHADFADFLRTVQKEISESDYSQAAFALLNLARLRYSAEPSPDEGSPEPIPNPLILPDHTSPQQVLASADQLVQAAAVLARGISNPDVSHII